MPQIVNRLLSILFDYLKENILVLGNLKFILI